MGFFNKNKKEETSTEVETEEDESTFSVGYRVGGGDSISIIEEVTKTKAYEIYDKIKTAYESLQETKTIEIAGKNDEEYFPKFIVLSKENIIKIFVEEA